MSTSPEARGPWQEGPALTDRPPPHRLADWAARCWPWSQQTDNVVVPDTTEVSGTTPWLGWDGWVATTRPDDLTRPDDQRPA